MSYERRIIGFIDILGFGQLVFDSECDAEKFNLIDRVISRLQEVDDIYGSPEAFFAHSNYMSLSEEGKASLNAIYESMKADATASRVLITTFSDSIVFSCPATSDGLTNFRYFLIKLLVYTSEFSLLLRGGMSCGPLIHSEKKVFGPAMNRAYLTESKVAKYPRIAVDEYFMSFINDVTEDSIGNLVRSEIITDPSDGVTFFDVLSLSTNKVAQNMCGSNPLDILTNEKRTIENLMASSSGAPEIVQKINWYATYFNHHLDRCPEIELVTSTFNGLPFESIMVPVANLKVQNA